jgi:hypothetical protein
VHRFRVVGVTGFAGQDSPASELDSFDAPTVAVLQTVAAQRLLGRGDTVDEVDLRAAPGVDPDALRDRVARLLPEGRLEAVTAADLAARQAGEVQGYVDGLGAVLLAFAALALLVGGFIIWNTFTVLVAGRTRDLALQRLLGATRRQVLGSVLAEAAVVGLAAAARVAAGAGAAVGLRALLRGLGNTLPPAGLVLAPRTLLLGLGVGALVTSSTWRADCHRPPWPGWPRSQRWARPCRWTPGTSVSAAPGSASRGSTPRPPTGCSTWASVPAACRRWAVPAAACWSRPGWPTTMAGTSAASSRWGSPRSARPASSRWSGSSAPTGCSPAT